MVNYETLMLVRTEITGDEAGALESQIDKIVSGKKGSVTLFDKWGKYKLAYPVKKNLYGIYILARYELPVDQVSSCFNELDTLFRIKYNELVLRRVTVRLVGSVSSVYRYPEPIGSHGTSNLDSFIKENKMKGLIETPVEKSPKREREKEESEGRVEGQDSDEEKSAEVTEAASADTAPGEKPEQES